MTNGTLLATLLLLAVAMVTAVRELNPARSHKFVHRFTAGKFGTVDRTVAQKPAAVRHSHRPVSKLPDNKGYATNCENPVVQPFNMSWEPEPIRPSDGITVEIHFNAVLDYAGGLVHLYVYPPGEQPPIIVDTINITCSEAHEYLPDFKCPFQKGDKIQAKYTRPSLTQIPPATYKLKVEMLDKNGKIFLCALAKITITD